MFIPIAAFAALSPNLIQHLINRYIYVAAPFFLVIQFFIGRDEFGFYLAPFAFLILFLPVLPFNWKVILIGVACFVILADLGARSNVIKFFVPLLVSISYYFKSILSIRFLNVVRLVLISLPLILFGLGISGIFNVFNPYGNQNVELIERKRDLQGELIQENLLVDTRTFLYVEVLGSAQKFDSWIIGRSPAKGNISESFGHEDPKKRNERNANEVGILNYFTWLGIIGVGFMFFIYLRASWLAIRFSNNFFCKIIGLYVAFRWSYGWVEDTNNFHIQYVYLWLIIGMCFSENFRKMTDLDMQNWVLGIFKTNQSL